MAFYENGEIVRVLNANNVGNTKSTSYRDGYKNDFSYEIEDWQMSAYKNNFPKDTCALDGYIITVYYSTEGILNYERSFSGGGCDEEGLFENIWLYNDTITSACSDFKNGLNHYGSKKNGLRTGKWVYEIGNGEVREDYYERGKIVKSIFYNEKKEVIKEIKY